jgi:hypothetical protein
MSLLKYLQTINTIDPGNIYVENVRSVLNISGSSAKLICEMAVQEKLFVKQIGLVCPNEDRIIKQYNSYDEIPEEITCQNCEAMEEDTFVFATSQLRKVEFYQLNK